MPIKISTLLILVSFAFANPLYATSSDGLDIENAWISEAPPVSRVMVAYMKINNNTNQPIDIIKADSEYFSSIEFHETVHEGGMARMVRWSELTVPANGSVELKRGGKHLMLFNPIKYLKAGETIKIKLTTSQNTTKMLSVTVKKAQF